MIDATPRLTKSTLLLGVMLVAGCATPQPTPPPTYIVLPIGPPPPLPGDPGFGLGTGSEGPFGEATPSPDEEELIDPDQWAYAINEANQVAGFVYSESFVQGVAAFRFGYSPLTWELYEFKDVMPLIPPPSVQVGWVSRGLYIGDSGTVVGRFAEHTSSPEQGYASKFVGPPGFPATNWVFERLLDDPPLVAPTGVNSEGLISMNVRFPEEEEKDPPWIENACLLETDGTLTVLSEKDSFVSDINVHGTAIGFSYDEPWKPGVAVKSWIWKDGALQTPPAGVEFLSSSKLNDNEDFLVYHSLYRDGAFESFSTPLYLAGFDHSRLKALNNHGHIVGFGWSDPFSNGHPDESSALLIWDGEIFRLEDLVKGNQWSLTHAYDINDAGFIAGSGLLYGKRRAFLLVPIDS